MLALSLKTQEAQRHDLVVALELLDARTAATRQALVRAKVDLASELESIGWRQQATPEDQLPQETSLEDPFPIVSKGPGVSAVPGVRARTNPTAMHALAPGSQDHERDDVEVRSQVCKSNLS